MIQIPLGTIPRVNDLIEKLDLKLSIQHMTLRRNIAYTLQYIKFVEWLLKNSDLALTAKEQTIKYGIVALNAVLDGAVRDHLERPPYLQPSQRFQRNIEKLKTKKLKPLSGHLANRLIKAHRKREKIHLYCCGDKLEHGQYSMGDFIEIKEITTDYLKWLAS